MPVTCGVVVGGTVVVIGAEVADTDVEVDVVETDVEPAVVSAVLAFVVVTSVVISVLITVVESVVVPVTSGVVSVPDDTESVVIETDVLTVVDVGGEVVVTVVVDVYGVREALSFASLSLPYILNI